MPMSSKFLTESTGEKIMKIGQYLAKIWTKYDSLVFWGPPCSVDVHYSLQCKYTSTRTSTSTVVRRSLCPLSADCGQYIDSIAAAAAAVADDDAHSSAGLY